MLATWTPSSFVFFWVPRSQTCNGSVLTFLYDWIYPTVNSFFKVRIGSHSLETKWEEQPLYSLLPSQSLNVLPEEETPGTFSRRRPKTCPILLFHYSYNIPRPGWENNLFYICVCSYNILPLKVLLLIVAPGDNSPGTLKHAKVSTAGWLSSGVRVHQNTCWGWCALLLSL